MEISAPALHLEGESFQIPRISSSILQRPGFGSWWRLGQLASLSWNIGSRADEQEWNQSQGSFSGSRSQDRALSPPSHSKPGSLASPHPVSSLLLVPSLHCSESKNPNSIKLECKRVLIFCKTTRRIMGKHYREYIKGVGDVWALGERVDPTTAVTSRIWQKWPWASSGHFPQLARTFPFIACWNTYSWHLPSWDPATMLWKANSHEETPWCNPGNNRPSRALRSQSRGDTVLDARVSLQVTTAPPQSGCNHTYVCMFVAQSCPTLCDPVDYSLPGSSVHGILQARLLEWVAIPFSRESPQLRDWTQLSCMAGRFFTIWAIRKPAVTWETPAELLLVSLHKHKQ